MPKNDDDNVTDDCRTTDDKSGLQRAASCLIWLTLWPNGGEVATVGTE